jgi:hypothetical protein
MNMTYYEFSFLIKKFIFRAVIVPLFAILFFIIIIPSFILTMLFGYFGQDDLLMERIHKVGAWFRKWCGIEDSDVWSALKNGIDDE